MNEPLRPALALDVAALQAGAVFAQALAPGTALGPYRIRRVLGAGGFGITYLAQDTALDLEVAIKEFLPSAIAARSAGGTVRPLSPAQGEDFAWGLERFRAEAKTLAKLEHPNIVRVRDFREANGTAYAVMEFVAGETLEARLARTNTLAADELAALLPALWSGIEAVHSAGFLHRDLKPSNIMLRTDEKGRSGTPVLIDFGAARQALSAHSRSLTAVLSEGYAPYEQYQRDGDQGAWTDVYALGATLYRCVTGEKPVEATRRIDARVKGKPDPLVPARELGAGRYPAPLLAAIDRALATVETERPRTIRELRRLAETPDTAPVATLPSGAPAPPLVAEGATLVVGPAASARGGETLLAGAAPPVEGAPTAPRPRRRWLRLAAVAAAVALLGGAAAAGYVVYRDRQAALEEARRAEEDQLRRRAAEEERRRAAEREEAEAKAAAARDLEAGVAAARAGRHDEALDLLSKAIASGRLAAEQHAEALLARGRVAAAKGDFARALAEVEEAIRVDPQSAAAYIEHGRLQWHRRLPEAALADFNEALRLDPKSAEAYALRAIVWFTRRDYDRAIADCDQALRLNPGYADAHFNRGLAFQAKGERAKAIADFKAVLASNPADDLARNARRMLESLGAPP